MASSTPTPNADINNSAYPAESSSLMQVDKFKHTWTVDHFSLYPETNCQGIYSEMFVGSVGKTKWRLLLLPNCQRESVKNWVTVRLKSCNKTPITAALKLTTFDGNRREVPNASVTFKPHTYQPEEKYAEVGLAWRSALQDLAKDTLVITAEVTVLGRRTTNTKPSAMAALKASHQSLVSDLRDSLNDGDTTDITIRVGVDPEARSEIRAHRAILAARSPVFRGMLNTDMKERTDGVIVIEDMSAEEFHTFLHYLYTAKASITPGTSTALYTAADKYEVNALKQECVLHILSNMSVENVCETFCLGDMHNDEQLKSEALAFIEANLAEVHTTLSFKQLLKTPSVSVFAEMIASFLGRRDNSSK